MEKLKEVINKYGRWSAYSLYVDRIEAHADTDFSLCFENAKSLIEGISKQICSEKEVELKGDESVNKLVKQAFDAIGMQTGSHLNIIGGSLSAIAHQVGNLRNAIGANSHGKTIDELNTRNENIDFISKEFLLSSVDLVSSFMIRNFENENPRDGIEDMEESLKYWQAEDFNESWDDSFGDFEMGNYSYPASEILFNVDKQAYINEYKAFTESET